jgi:cell division protein ZapA (FtsZ GTPase activity inhibitor)
MRTVKAVIYGKEHALACDDGQEPQLRALAEKLNKRCHQLGTHLGGIHENLMLIYAALTFIDEGDEAGKKLAVLENAMQHQGNDGKLQTMQEDLAANLSDLANKIERIAGNLQEAA